jgi:hypothetical protein
MIYQVTLTNIAGATISYGGIFVILFGLAWGIFRIFRLPWRHTSLMIAVLGVMLVEPYNLWGFVFGIPAFLLGFKFGKDQLSSLFVSSEPRQRRVYDTTPLRAFLYAIPYFVIWHFVTGNLSGASFILLVACSVLLGLYLGRLWTFAAINKLWDNVA